MYSGQGLVLLGMNTSDAKDVALEELRRQNVSFTNIIDSSPAATKVSFEYRGSGVPLNYVIDREGRIADGWYGNEEDFSRAMKAVSKAGIKDARPLDTRPAATEPATPPATERG
jgi:hypothetical protein